MNSNILLVATREIRQIARTRSFWMTLLILPLMLAVVPMLSRLIDPPSTQTVMLIDRSTSQAGATIAARIGFDQQRDQLIALADFASRNDLQKLAPDAVWTHKANWYPDALVAQFVAQGGGEAALAAIRKHDSALADRFVTPRANYELLTEPEAVKQAPYDALDAALAPVLRPPDGSGRKPVDYVLAIPPDFGTRPDVHLWTNGQPRPAFMALIQTELTRTLRGGFLQAQGVAPPVAAIANRLEPAIALTRPQQGAGRERLVIQSILPVAMAYILLMSLFMSGNWMLQSTIEERSGKLLEAVLACVSPRDFMLGKLVGTLAIGLMMVMVWVACGLFAGFATQGAIADLIRPALAPLSSPGSVIAIVYFFLTGYVMISMIFLTIGAMSDSMQDAQGFLMPTMLLLMMPVLVLMQVVMSGTDSLTVKVMTWIPLFTPFAVLARLGSGLPTLEIVGSGLLLLAFVAFEFAMLGRVFRASLLNGGGRPSLKALVGMMRQG